MKKIDAYLNGGTACRWYFNPDIKEAAPYYQRYVLSTNK